MSFDIFMHAFRDGEPAKFKRAMFDEVFGASLTANEDGFASAAFPDDSGGQMFFGDGDEIDGVMFNHCGGEAFSNAMYELMKRTGSVIFWPGSGGYVVADRAVVAHLPPGMMDESDKLTVVSSGPEIFDAITAS